MKDTLSKSEWLAAQQCLTMAWFSLRKGLAALSEADLFRMEQGKEVGSLARTLYPNGILVSKTDAKSAASLTQDLIADPSIETLFEAAFSHGAFVARADILRRLDGGWHVLEVKSSFSDTSSIKDLVDDLAYTVMVLKRAGLSVTKASLVLLSRTFRFGDIPTSLFEIVEKTVEANQRAIEFENAADNIAKILFDSTSPPAVLVSACRSCNFFDESCLGSGVAHTVLEIPSLHYTKLKRLSASGIVDLASAPADLKLNPRQERARDAALSGKMIVEPGLGATLQSITWPCHYLDFETVATALPIYTGHACHQQVLTQFSIHHRESIDAQPTHSEYLADATKVCERELAEVLISTLGNKGSVIVYSSFEETRIKSLRDAFPDLATQLQAILGRIMDILPVIQDNIYHPEFRGSFSIKKVLPALVPDLSYAGLEIADGDAAITRFARMARGEISGKDVETTRQHLLTYCELDTYAMVRLHETLIHLAAAQQVKAP
jgi:CRISPR/Cas system-associated exonuclease Cas4 (RecB family)